MKTTALGSAKTDPMPSPHSCKDCQELREAIATFFGIWDQRVKNHFWDRRLMDAVRKLRKKIGEGWIIK